MIQDFMEIEIVITENDTQRIKELAHIISTKIKDLIK